MVIYTVNMLVAVSSFESFKVENFLIISNLMSPSVVGEGQLSYYKIEEKYSSGPR